MIIEKPVGISLEELRQMREAVRQAGVQTVVSFVLRGIRCFARSRP